MSEIGEAVVALERIKKMLACKPFFRPLPLITHYKASTECAIAFNPEVQVIKGGKVNVRLTS